MGAPTWNPNAGEIQRQADFWGSPASHNGHSLNSRFSERLCLEKKISWRVIGRLLWSPLVRAHTKVCVCTQTHMHTYVRTKLCLHPSPPRDLGWWMVNTASPIICTGLITIPGCIQEPSLRGGVSMCFPGTGLRFVKSA